MYDKHLLFFINRSMLNSTGVICRPSPPTIITPTEHQSVPRPTNTGPLILLSTRRPVTTRAAGISGRRQQSAHWSGHWCDALGVKPYPTRKRCSAGWLSDTASLLRLDSSPFSLTDGEKMGVRTEHRLVFNNTETWSTRRMLNGTRGVRLKFVLIKWLRASFGETDWKTGFGRFLPLHTKYPVTHLSALKQGGTRRHTHTRSKWNARFQALTQSLSCDQFSIVHMPVSQIKCPRSLFREISSAVVKSSTINAEPRSFASNSSTSCNEIK